MLAPGGISDAQRDYWIGVMDDVIETDAYQDWVESGLLQDTSLTGDEFTEYLEKSNDTVQQAMEG